MPIVPNPNKYTIVSNNKDALDSYYSDQGSGINLHAPVSMEGSVQILDPNGGVTYYPTDNDYFIYGFSGNIGYTVNLTVNTYKNGKILVIKCGRAGVGINIVCDIDGTGSNLNIGTACENHSVMIIYDKPSGFWYIMADYLYCP